MVLSRKRVQVFELQRHKTRGDEAQEPSRKAEPLRPLDQGIPDALRGRKALRGYRRPGMNHPNARRREPGNQRTHPEVTTRRWITNSAHHPQRENRLRST